MARPSIFLSGLRLLLASKRTVLWSYLALLVVGLIGGASMDARIGPFLDHSLAAQKLVGGIDVAYYAELFEHANEHDPGNGPVTAGLTMLSVLLSFFFAAGTIHVFLTAEKPRLAVVLRAGVEYFWRFFRLMLFAALIGGLILGPLGWLRSIYLKHADDKFVEAAYDLRAVLTLAVLLLIALALRLWFDLAEVHVVQMGRKGDRRVRRSLGPALRLFKKHFAHIYLSYFTAGTLGVLGFAFFFWIWAKGQTSHLILPVFCWSQIGLLFLLASRIWQRGILSALVIATTEPPPIVVYAVPDPPEPPAPVESETPAEAGIPATEVVEGQEVTEPPPSVETEIKEEAHTDTPPA